MRSLKETEQQPVVGELNTNYFVYGGDGRIFLKRVPKDNPQIFTSIFHEYSYISFVGSGGQFRRRTSHEQVNFTLKAYQLGLRVLPPLLHEGDLIYYPFIGGAVALDEYQPQTIEGWGPVVYELFNDLWRAHELGLIYGDRWSKNILISPQYGPVHIDFDIEISGRWAREFEVAQLAYYTLSAGKDRVIPLLAKLLGVRGWFDLPKAEQFLCGHADYFFKTKYGGIQQETEALICLLHKQQEASGV